MSKLTKDDLQRAFRYLENKDTKVDRIIANPAFANFLFESSVSIPVSFDETQIGIRFISNSSGIECYVYSLQDFEEDAWQNFTSIVTSHETGQTDTTQIRIWRHDSAPPCLRQFSEDRETEWVILVPPSLSEVDLNFLDPEFFAFSTDACVLPGGWQVVYFTI
jgi:hypothetical protein